MGLENPLHLALLLIIILLVFGAKRLPELGRSLGECIRGFKQSISGEEHRRTTEEKSQPGSAPPDLQRPHARDAATTSKE